MLQCTNLYDTTSEGHVWSLMSWLETACVGAISGSLIMDLCERMLETSFSLGTAVMCVQTVSISGRAGWSVWLKCHVVHHLRGLCPKEHKPAANVIVSSVQTADLRMFVGLFVLL